MDYKNTIIIDCETTGLSIEKDEIKMFGYYDFDTDSYGEILFTKEATYDPVYEINHLLKNKIYIIGFNIKSFDIPFLCRYGINVDWKQFIDLYWITRNRAPLMKYHFDSFSLKNVCKVMGLGEKKDIDIKVLTKKDNTFEETIEIAKYLRQDIEITKALFLKLDEIFQPLNEYLNDYQKNRLGHLVFSPASYSYKVLCNLTGIREEYEQDVKAIPFEGGYVSKPEKESYTGNIYCVDLTSAYPHSFFQFNLFTPANCGKCSCIGECKKTFKSNNILELSQEYCISEQGKLESVIRKLYLKRIEYKLVKDSREYALKILLNCCYGIVSSPIFKSIYDYKAASDCTYIIRTWIKYCRKRFLDFGYTLIYSDTDSCYILDPFNDKNKLIEIKDKIISELKQDIPFPAETFSLGIEYELKAMFFHRDKTGIKKKNYICITKEDKPIVKGFQIIKSNCSKVSKEIWKILEPQIVKNLDMKFDEQYIMEMIEEKVKTDISLASIKFNTKNTNEYQKSPTGLYSEISKMYGEGEHYLIKNYFIGAGKKVKYCSLEESKKLTFEQLDLSSIIKELSPFIKPETENNHSSKTNLLSFMSKKDNKLWINHQDRIREGKMKLNNIPEKK